MRKYNWSHPAPGCWIVTTWTLFTDRALEADARYSSPERKTEVWMLSEEVFNTIMRLVKDASEVRPWDGPPFPGCDGVGWKAKWYKTSYDNDNEDGEDVDEGAPPPPPPPPPPPTSSFRPTPPYDPRLHWRWGPDRIVFNVPMERLTNYFWDNFILW